MHAKIELDDETKLIIRWWILVIPVYLIDALFKFQTYFTIGWVIGMIVITLWMLVDRC